VLAQGLPRDQKSPLGLHLPRKGRRPAPLLLPSPYAQLPARFVGFSIEDSVYQMGREVSYRLGSLILQPSL